MFLNNYHYSIKLYNGITMSISLALSICVLVISHTQLVNGEKFWNVTFLFVLFSAALAAAILLTVLVPLTNIYMRHYNHIN